MTIILSSNQTHGFYEGNTLGLLLLLLLLLHCIIIYCYYYYFYHYYYCYYYYYQVCNNYSLLGSGIIVGDNIKK